MNTVTLTLALTPENAIRVLNLVSQLDTSISTESPSKSIVDYQYQHQQLTEMRAAPLIKHPKTAQDSTKTSSVSPTAGKTIRMPSLGRSQTAIDTFAQSEASRIEAKEEEAELREQRKAERDARNTIKDEEAAEKKRQSDKENKEIEDIKAAAAANEIGTPLPKKPWEQK